MEKKIELMQKGRRLAYLKKCLIVSELVQKYESETTVRKQVFGKFIQPVLLCSYNTFNNMMNEPNPQKQIDNLLNNEN